ncbi:MAG TPA: hypothetical protein DEQ02_06650, partial [Ruminococcaceae bacterium]|nr:hypothetical protein [Oscillospiraceae bacterium]
MKKKPHGHYCRICQQYKANEKFNGRGHAAHICKVCAKRGNRPPKNEPEPLVFIGCDDLDEYGLLPIWALTFYRFSMTKNFLSQRKGSVNRTRQNCCAPPKRRRLKPCLARCCLTAKLKFKSLSRRQIRRVSRMRPCAAPKARS